MEKATRAETALDKYEAKFGLEPLASALNDNTENEATRLLNIPPDELKRMNSIECAEAAFILEQYALYLQRAVNSAQSRANWAEARINRLVGNILHQQPGYNHQERRIQAICIDDAARETEAIRADAQLKADRIAYIAGRVSTLSNRMSELGYRKVVRNG